MLLTALLGAGIGLVMALTGAGGGILAVPALIFACRLPLAQATPIALLAASTAALLGTVLGLRTRHVRYRAAALMAGAGFLGAPLGVWCAQHIPNRPLLFAFAAVLAASALRLLLFPDEPLTDAQRARVPCAFDPAVGQLRWTARCARVLGTAGFCAGVLASMLGVGGGFVLAPVLMHVTDLDTPSVTATTLAVIALVTLASFLATWASGQAIAWPLALPFVAGALAGLAAGRHIAAGAHPKLLRRAFAAVSLGVAALLVVHAAGAA